MNEQQWPSPVEAEMHIRGELQRLGLGFKEDRNSFSIICPHPHPGGGPNTHYNYRIKKDGKTSHCFVCKATGSWQKIAGELGASKFNSSGLVGDEGADLNMGAAIRRRLALTALDDDIQGAPDGMTPWQGSWRGLPETFLRRVHAHRWLQPWYGSWVERIWFPCMQWNEFVGYAARRLDKVDEQRWYNAPWMKSTEVLFGFDVARSMGSRAVAIVEGPGDALTLLNAGIPAVAVLGTRNIGQKEALLIAAGFTRGYVVFDADAAGNEAAPVMLSRLRTVMQHAENILLPPGKDPGGLSGPELAWLRDHIRP